MNIRKAIEYAEEALEAGNPENVSNDIAARALRAAASIYTGEGDHYFEDEWYLRKQSPETDVERLLVAITFMLQSTRLLAGDSRGDAGCPIFGNWDSRSRYGR